MLGAECYDPRATRGSFHPSIGRKVRGDRALVRQIGERAGGQGSMVRHEQRAWSRGLFSGTRHLMTWVFEGDDVAGGEQLLVELDERDYDLPGHLVCNAAVISGEHRAFPPLLTLELEVMVVEHG